MTNNCARVPDMRTDLNAQGITVDDARMSQAIAEASKALFTGTGGRQFFTTTDTRYFSGTNERLFLLGADLLSVTSLKISNTVYQPSSFENTLVAGTDYTLWPRNAPVDTKPYRGIMFNPNGQYSVAPFGVDNIQIVGKWGYYETTEAIVSGGSAVTGTLTTAGDLTITASVDVTDLIYIGDTLYIEDEQLTVTAVSTTTITVVRGINGTTAVAHTTQPISIRRFPEDIERAVRADAARYLWRAAQGYPEGGFREMWPAIADCLRSYQDPAGVI